MGPKKKKKKKPSDDEFRCDDIQGEKFYTQTDDVSSYSWWEVFCFPYIICSKFWDCCVSLCAGANQCLVYLMLIQWCICKIKRATTPDPIIFPYYFYMFCQIILLTVTFILLWIFLGKSVVMPFFEAFYRAFVEDYGTSKVKTKRKNTTRMSFRKYCFKKGEIFDTPIDSNGSPMLVQPIGVITFLIEVFLNEVL